MFAVRRLPSPLLVVVVVDYHPQMDYSLLAHLFSVHFVLHFERLDPIHARTRTKQMKNALLNHRAHIQKSGRMGERMWPNRQVIVKWHLQQRDYRPLAHQMGYLRSQTFYSLFFFVLTHSPHHSHTFQSNSRFNYALLSPWKFSISMRFDALASILLTLSLTLKYHTIHKIRNIIDEYNNYCNHLLYVSFFSSFCHDSSPNGDYCDSFNLMETFQWIRPPIRVLVCWCVRVHCWYSRNCYASHRK